jgi:hypothetical protein
MKISDSCRNLADLHQVYELFDLGQSGVVAVLHGFAQQGGMVWIPRSPARPLHVFRHRDPRGEGNQ